MAMSEYEAATSRNGLMMKQSGSETMMKSSNNETPMMMPMMKMMAAADELPDDWLQDGAVDSVEMEEEDDGKRKKNEEDDEKRKDEDDEKRKKNEEAAEMKRKKNEEDDEKQKNEEDDDEKRKNEEKEDDDDEKRKNEEEGRGGNDDGATLPHPRETEDEEQRMMRMPIEPMDFSLASSDSSLTSSKMMMKKAANRPLWKLRNLLLLMKKRRPAALAYLRPEFRRYAERSMPSMMAASSAQGPAEMDLLLPTSSRAKRRRRRLLIQLQKVQQEQPKSPADGHQKRRTKKLASALLRRALHSTWMPLPRLPAFRCAKCGLMSRHLRVLEHHLCSCKRMADYKNVAQTVELGFRSRAKDALAVLERIPRPQAAVLGRNGKMRRLDEEDEGEQRSQPQPKTLCELAWRCVQRMHGLDRSWSVVKTVEQTATKTTTNTPAIGFPSTSSASTSGITIDDHDYGVKKKKRRPNKEVDDDDQEKKEEESPCSDDGVAYFCRRCARLFGQYADWDQHLANGAGEGKVEEAKEEACGAEEPMEVQVLPDERFPVAGRLLSAYQQLQQQHEATGNALFSCSMSSSSMMKNGDGNPSCMSLGAAAVNHCCWQCSKCGTAGFVSRAEFHAHLLKCALLAAMMTMGEEKERDNNERKATTTTAMAPPGPHGFEALKLMKQNGGGTNGRTTTKNGGGGNGKKTTKTGKRKR